MIYDPTKPSLYNNWGFNYRGSRYEHHISQSDVRKVARKILTYFGFADLAEPKQLEFRFTCRHPERGWCAVNASPKRIITLHPAPMLGIVIHEVCHIVAFVNARTGKEARSWHGERFKSYLFRAFRLYGIVRQNDEGQGSINQG